MTNLHLEAPEATARAIQEAQGLPWALDPLEARTADLEPPLREALGATEAMEGQPTWGLTLR